MANNHVEIPTIELIRKRLEQIFPDGFPNRANLIGIAAARSIQVMFYSSAIAGRDTWVRPAQIIRMSDRQMGSDSDSERELWRKLTLGPKAPNPADSWYNENSREQVRDDTLRNGLVEVGAVVVRDDIKPTSSLPRYALSEAFAGLFADFGADGDALEKIDAWQKVNLSPGAIAKSAIKRRLTAPTGKVEVTLPSGGVRNLSPGESSLISKAVIEDFARIYLVTPQVLLLSESGNKLIWQDADLCEKVRLPIDVSGNLPDLILVDLDPPDSEILFVFVEVVHSDGPVTEKRRRELMEFVRRAGYDFSQVAFLTAFSDRSSKAFAKARARIAWDTFAWFASEPEHLLCYRSGSTSNLMLGKLVL